MSGPSSCPVCGAATDLFAEHSVSEPRWEVRRCPDCRHGRTLPALDDEEIASLYPDDYFGSPERYLKDLQSGRLEGTRTLNRLRRRVGQAERCCAGGRILDVGCGGAHFLAALDADRWERTGLEPVAETVARVQPLIPDVTLITGTLSTVELPAAGFDCITFWHVLEHVEDPRATLAQVAALLAPGGTVLINVPHFDSWQAQVFRRHWYALDAPRHRHHFSADSLSRLLAETGLRPERLAPVYEVFNSLKQSLLRWSEATFSSRVPYYLLKPAIFPCHWGEVRSRRAGMLAMAGRKDDD